MWFIRIIWTRSYNDSRYFFEIRANIVRNVKGLDVDHILFLMKDFDEWKITFEDMWNFFLQKQMVSITDYSGITRGYYWSRNSQSPREHRKGLFFKQLTSKINLLPLVNFFENYIDLRPHYRIYRTWNMKYKHIFRTLSFSHSRKLEWFFFAWPSTIICCILMPSVALITELDTEVVDPDLIVKVLGSQWYWTYDYLIV